MRKSLSVQVSQSVQLSITFILCVCVMACYHRQSQSTHGLNSPSQSTPPVTAPAQSVPPLIAVPLPQDTQLVDGVLVRLQDCVGLLPICQPGGLLKQSALVDEINAYMVKYQPETGKCRWMQPPRCYTKEKRACKQQCTP